MYKRVCKYFLVIVTYYIAVYQDISQENISLVALFWGKYEKYIFVCDTCPLWESNLLLEALVNHSTSAQNRLRPRQYGRHFADDYFKRIFFNKNVWISIKISLKFVPKGPINKIPALFQIMAWRCPVDKPLSEAMLLVYWRINASLGLNELTTINTITREHI